MQTINYHTWLITRAISCHAVRNEERAAAERCWRRLHHVYSVAASCTHARPAQAGKEGVKAKGATDSARNTSTEAAEVATAYIGKVSITWPHLRPSRNSGTPCITAQHEPYAQVVEHSVAVNNKISELNRTWPEVIEKYKADVRAEMSDPERLLKRYASVAYCVLD